MVTSFRFWVANLATWYSICTYVGHRGHLPLPSMSHQVVEFVLTLHFPCYWWSPHVSTQCTDSADDIEENSVNCTFCSRIIAFVGTDDCSEQAVVRVDMGKINFKRSCVKKTACGEVQYTECKTWEPDDDYPTCRLCLLTYFHGS